MWRQVPLVVGGSAFNHVFDDLPAISPIDHFLHCKAHAIVKSGIDHDRFYFEMHTKKEEHGIIILHLFTLHTKKNH